MMNLCWPAMVGRASSLAAVLMAASVMGLSSPASAACAPDAPAATEVKPTADPAKALTTEQTAEDAALLRRALELVHPGLYRYSSKTEIDAAFAAFESSLAGVKTNLDLYREVSLLVAKIRCDHTKAEVPAGLDAFRKKVPSFLPFRFKVIGGRMFVASCDPAQALLARGDEVVSINGRSVAELFETIRPVISVDGFTDAVKDTKLEADSDLLGCDFDHFYPVFFGFPADFDLQVKPWSERGAGAGGAGAERAVNMKPVTFKQWTELPWSAVSYREEFHKSATWKMLDEQTAYVRVDTFVNYRNPVPPAQIYDPIFKAIAEKNAQRLIIDLRENGGGSSDATVELAKYILGKPFVWNRGLLLKAVRYGDLPKYIQSWGDPKELFEPSMDNFTRLPDGMYEERAELSPLERLEQQPSPYRFNGKVTVLTGPANASGSTMLIAKLKDAGNVRLVGSATGGSAEGPTCGQLFFTKLPNSQIVVRVPIMWNRMNLERFPSANGGKTFRVGYGVSPDVEVVQTLEDFVAGRDTVLEAALK
jgi:hypothetical protein